MTTRRRFLGLFGGGAVAASVPAAAVAAPAAAPDAPAAAVDGPMPSCEKLLLEAFRNSVAVLHDDSRPGWGGGAITPMARMQEIKTALDVLEQLDRLGLRQRRVDPRIRDPRLPVLSIDG